MKEKNIVKVEMFFILQIININKYLGEIEMIKVYSILIHFGLNSYLKTMKQICLMHLKHLIF